jgi:hypothetical protein
LYDSLIYIGVSIFPISIWFIRNNFLSHDFTGRQIYYHFIDLEFFKQSLKVFSKWLFPLDHISGLIKIVLSLIILIGFIILLYPTLKNRFKIENFNNFIYLLFPVIPFTYNIYCLNYLLFLLISKSLFDAYIPMDQRIVSPLFGPFIIILMYIIFKIYQFYKCKYILKNLIYSFCLLLAAMYLITGSKWAFNAYKDGQGYGSIIWKESDILKNINTIKSERVYSNACDAIYIITGKSCYRLPSKYDPASLIKNNNYLLEIHSLSKQLENKKAVLVWIDKLSWRRYLPSEEELKNELNLRIINKYSDGAIYGIGD